MVEVPLKGVHKVKAKGRLYYYAWRGGPAIKDAEGNYLTPGDENFNVYAIDPTQPAETATGTPPTRALTNFKGVRTMIYAAPKAKPDTLYIGLNDIQGSGLASP